MARRFTLVLAFMLLFLAGASCSFKSAIPSGWTGSHVNQYMTTILNDEVTSVAYVMSPVSEQGTISGYFSKESAEELAHVLSSGSLGNCENCRRK
jgi:preprotein translocase subunit SecD